MGKIVFDIETKNTFQDVGTNNAADLDLSLIAIYDSETDSYTSYLEDELPELWKILEHADMLIGYNSDHFDIPLLNKYYPGDLTAIKSLDLMKEVQKSLGRRLRLDSIAQATLKVGKSGHGLDAIKWWHEGEIEKIRKYCVKDVEITKRVYDYATEHGKLKYKDFKRNREVEVDTSEWDTLPESALTHTLPF